MPTEGFGGNGNRGSSGVGPSSESETSTPSPQGSVPYAIELGWLPEESLRVGLGVTVHLATILQARVRDEMGRAVLGSEIEWASNNEQIARVEGGFLKARHKGSCDVFARVIGTTVRSATYM